MVVTECVSCPNLTVLQWHQGDEWKTTQASPRQLLPYNDQDCVPISEETRVSVIIASANKIRTCPECRQALTEYLQMNEVWWADYCKNPSGHFGCETTFRAGKTSGINTWAFFQVKQLLPENRKKPYEWNKINVFTRWIPSTKQTILLLFDPKSPIRETVPKALLNPDVTLLDNPYWCYLKVLHTVSSLQEKSVWTIRDHVRPIEKTVMAEPIPRPDWRKFHDIARHAIHVTETLDVTIETIECLQYHYRMFIKETDHTMSPVDHTIGAQLGFFRGYISSMRHRSISNEKRLQNEIHLAFNTVAQYNAGTSVEITRAALADSSAMKTIAFVTLIFLPPTFISSIFSMSFFQCGENDGWGMSGDFWMYWVFAIPITVLTVAVWAYWHRLFPALHYQPEQSNAVEIPLEALKYDQSRLRDRLRGGFRVATGREDV